MTTGDDLVDSILLFLDSPTHQHYTVGSLYSYVVLPHKFNRLKVFREEGEAIGLLSWAWLSPDRADQFVLGLAKLNERDYVNTKGQLWGIDFIAPKGKVRQLLRQAREEHLSLNSDAEIRFRRLSDPSKVHIRKLK